jgi:hypothetical protein
MKQSTKRSQSYCVGVAAMIIFAVLLLFRLDVPRRFLTSAHEPELFNHNAFTGENWMSITQNGAKIGYAHRKMSRKEGGLEFFEQVFMRINTMGIVQPIEFSTSADLSNEGALRAFEFTLHSSVFQFSADGSLKDGRMIIRTGKDEKTTSIPLSNPSYLGVGLVETVAAENWSLGAQRTFPVFDPVTLSQRPVTITLLGGDRLNVMGKEQHVKKFSVDFHGMKQFAWVSPEGSVVREEGILGVVLQKVSKEDALAATNSAASSDLTAAAAIRSSRPIEKAQELRTLKMRLHNLPSDRFLLDGGRQTYSDGILTITREPFCKGPLISFDDLRCLDVYLAPTPFIQSDHPAVRKKVFEIVSPDESDQAKAEKLVAWVHENIQKRPTLSVPSALETLRNMTGDCNEHAVLLTALARASGLPAEIETGLVYMRGNFFFHAWNIFYIKDRGGWITADATLGQIPADVTHLRFARGGLENQADLAALIGSLSLEVIGTEK